MQKLKDIYTNGERKFVSELFNFFVRLTKVLHLAYVIVMTNDTFFIKEVYTSSSLKNTSIFYLVDYFDDEMAINILIEEGMSKKDAEYVVDVAGGVPWVMTEVLSGGNSKEKIENIYKQVRARLDDILAAADENGKYEETLELIKKILEGSTDIVRDRKKFRWLVEKELLFYDPINRDVRFQTKLDERAAKGILNS